MVCYLYFSSRACSRLKLAFSMAFCMFGALYMLTVGVFSVHSNQLAKELNIFLTILYTELKVKAQ